MVVKLNSLKMVVFLFAIALTQLAFAGAQVDTDDNGVALQGHDPVAYQTEEKPVMGSDEFTAEYNGATYKFASAENRDMFTADPEKYAPAYGGFCAFGTTFSKKVPGDPQAFKVVDGKLYINSSPDILMKWEGDIPGNVAKANGIWEEIKDKDPSEL
jgi:YHS domain-containing protein